MKVVRDDSPGHAAGRVREYLGQDPLRNTLILTLLESRVADSVPGRYWTVVEDGRVVGFATQTPLDRPIALSVMSADVAAALSQAIAAGEEEVSEVFGEAQAAARFAGEWAACRNVAARPVAGRRLYEARAISAGALTDGQAEKAVPAHQALVYDWVGAFCKEIREPPLGPDIIRERINAERVWLWKSRDFKSIVCISAPVCGTSRLQCVYTPPEHRRKGSDSYCTSSVAWD